jgi:hypothetical protein
MEDPCKHGSLGALSLICGPFHFVRRKVENELQTRLQESVDLRMTYFNITNYHFDNGLQNICSGGGLCASTRHVLHVFKVVHAQKFCVLQIDLPPSITLLCISSTSFTVMTFTVLLRWLQK